MNFTPMVQSFWVLRQVLKQALQYWSTLLPRARLFWLLFRRGVLSALEVAPSFFMNYQPPAKLFAPAAVARNQEPSSDDYKLVIRQKPVAAKMFIGKEKDRKPVDPPPIIQLRVSEFVDPSQNYLQSPYFFVSCSLLDDDETRSQVEKDEIKHGLAGTLVSSLHRLKDTDNTDGGFFVFGDLSVRVEGTFRLQFTLYEVRDKEVAYINSVLSGSFNVHASKNWPGMAESTFLTRSFSDQGVRLRLRKEPRSRLGARGPASDNYEPRRYKVHNRQQSQAEPQQPQQIQQTFQWDQEDTVIQRQTPIDYSTRQQTQQLLSPTLTFPNYQRKREYSHSIPSAPHAPQVEEPQPKRARTEPEQAHHQPYLTQQYSYGPEYGGKLYYPNQTTAVAFPSPPHQLYNSNFTSSPQSMTPRDQSNYFNTRRADPQFPSISSTYESPAARHSNSQSQRFPSDYDYTTPSPQASQIPSNLQQPQTHYIPQLSQPMPPIRTPISMPVYNVQFDSEQASVLPRPIMLTASDMPPPVFGRGAMPAIGSLHTGGMILPSMGGDFKYPGTSMFDFKQRDSNVNH